MIPLKFSDPTTERETYVFAMSAAVIDTASDMSLPDMIMHLRRVGFDKLTIATYGDDVFERVENFHRIWVDTSHCRA